MELDLIAALDVGKTHSRIVVIDPSTGAEVWSAQRTNESVASPMGRQLDVARIEAWLVDALRNSPQRTRIGCIVPIAHGAAAVLIARDGRVLAAPDYEDSCFERASHAYDPQRDAYGETRSPNLPLGLNLGRQLFYLEQQLPELFAQAANVLLYPQFWAWRLSGVMASEVTSLGCHSDLWLPHRRTFSALVENHRWSALFPPLKSAGEELGPATGPVAVAAGLPQGCKILCGIHDSNASYLRHLIDRRNDPFAVISSGTWTVILANKASLDRLQPGRDMLANVDAFGNAVPTARFMGGREYEAIAAARTPGTAHALRSVIDKDALALPAFAAAGPFSNSTGRLVNAEGLSPAERGALASAYMALMCDYLLDSLGSAGEVIVDGPLAADPLFAPALAGLRPEDSVLTDEGPRAAIAICRLSGHAPERRVTATAIEPLDIDLDHYRLAWRSQLPVLASDGMHR